MTQFLVYNPSEGNAVASAAEDGNVATVGSRHCCGCRACAATLWRKGVADNCLSREATRDYADNCPRLWPRLISVGQMICHRCGIAVDFDAPDATDGTKQCGGLQSTTAGKGRASHGAAKWRLSRPTPDMLYEAEKQLERAGMELKLAATENNMAPHVEKDREAKAEFLRQAQAQLAQLEAQNTTPASRYGCYYCYVVEEHLSCCKCARALGCYNEPPCRHCEKHIPRVEKETPANLLSYVPLQI